MATHRILFVCLGNICRSPLAEGVLRKLVQDAGREQDFEIASCGTGSWHVGKPPHQGTLNLAHRYQLPLDGKRARVLCSADFTEYDLLVALDRSNYHDIRSVAKGIGAKLIHLREFDSEQGDLDVPDPYYTGDFDETYRIVERCCRRLLASLA